MTNCGVVTKNIYRFKFSVADLMDMGLVQILWMEASITTGQGSLPFCLKIQKPGSNTKVVVFCDNLILKTSSIHSGIQCNTSMFQTNRHTTHNISWTNTNAGENVHSKMQKAFIGCLLYADDIILLSPSISGLQEMLDICYKTSCSVSLQFNVAKCHLMVLGPLAGKPCPPLSLVVRASHGCSPSSI